MNLLAPFLENDRIIILDGALATELERRGEDLRDPLWSAKVLVENPDLIRQVHHDYLAAGADVITTASYQATIPGLVKRGLTREQAADVLRRSVHIAQGARDAFLLSSPRGRRARCEREMRRPLIAASIGCYGAALHDGSEYRGDYALSVEQLVDWHRPRLEILAASGADLLACETIPSFAEGEALIKLLGDFPGVPAWLSFSCKDERHLCHGESFADAVQLANDAPNVVAVGVNCTAPRFIQGLLDSVEGIARKPLVVYPNSGEAWDPQEQCWQGTNEQFSWREYVRRWRQAGARLIGGCCRTTPHTIRQIAESLG